MYTCVDIDFQNLSLNRTYTSLCEYIYNGPGDLGSIPNQVIPMTQKIVLDGSLLSTQHYKVRIKGKVEQSREMSSALPYILVS